MLNRKPKDEVHALDETIANLISGIAGLTDGDEAQKQAIESLKILMEIRSAELAEKRKLFVSPEVLVAAGAHLLGIAVILGFEQKNVITTKALSFVPKIRI